MRDFDDTDVIENDIQYMNEAEILGDPHPDLEDFLLQDMTFMTGDLYGQRDRRNTMPGKWKKTTMPLIQWLTGGALRDGTEWGLTRHPVNADKGGASVVPSENFEGERSAEATKTMFAIGIDIDTGNQLDKVIDKLLDAGVFAIVYTTHSHMKTGLTLKSDMVQKKLKITGTPTKAQIHEYLRDHHKDYMTPDFIKGVTIVDAKRHTKDGLHIVLETPPVEKFRVVIPLAKPVELADLADSFVEWKEVWADAVCGVCVNILDADFDLASCDVNRLFYTPRHPEGGEYYSAVIQGKPLVFEDIKPYSKARYLRNRKARTADPFLADETGSDGKQSVPQCHTPSGKSLNDWHSKAKGKNRFMIVDVLETHPDDKNRYAGGEASGTCHIECPFEHEHSTPGGTATMAMNPDANKDEVWTVFCHHDACQGRHKLEFLEEMLKQRWFPESVLFDDVFMLPPEDGDEDARLTALSEGPITDHTTEGIRSALADASINQDSSEADIEAFLRRCLDGEADTAARARITDAVVKETPLGKRDLNRLWKSLVSEHSARQRAANQSSDEAPINTGFGFEWVLEETLERLFASNKADPFLFEMRSELFELRQTPDGPKLKKLDYDALSEVISRHIKFVATNDSGNDLSIAPPLNVVKNIFHRDRADYALPLVAISEVPFFDKDGTLVSENGYHANSGIYVSMPDGFELPRVSETPSEDELDRAFDAFLEVFGEFPFDRLTPDEIANNQSASLANLIGLACLPFMRPMIEGPTSGHLFNKTRPGTGAGLALYCLHMIWTGRKPTVMTIPKRREEIPKTIIAKLRSGAFVIIFDNIPDNLDSDDLAVALSEGALDARVLGRNDAGAVDPVEITAIWIFTGNDVTMSNELLRRMTLIELDADMPSPEKRTFSKSEPELKVWVRDHRAELVWACLTLIQNWIANGRQAFKSDLVKGTFSEWLAAVGGVMESAKLHHHFYGNEEKLREESSSAVDEALFTFASILADFAPGHLFQVGGDDPCSILKLLNTGLNGRPIEIHGWGYSDEDGTYSSASGVGQHFKKFARRPHKARRAAGERSVEVEIGFDRIFDERSKVNCYRLKFRAPSAKDWITTDTEGAWKTFPEA